MISGLQFVKTTVGVWVMDLQLLFTCQVDGRYLIIVQISTYQLVCSLRQTIFFIKPARIFSFFCLLHLCLLFILFLYFLIFWKFMIFQLNFVTSKYLTVAATTIAMIITIFMENRPFIDLGFRLNRVFKLYHSFYLSFSLWNFHYPTNANAYYYEDY